MENCRILINHISYQSVHINFNQNTQPYLNIKLKSKNIHIRQVKVESVNKRNKNMEYFKKKFLGDDKQGKSATIENDSVILFNVEYDDQKHNNLYEDYNYFEVSATAPLQIHLPKLGYILQYDLAKFIETYNQDIGIKTIQNLGYSYFEEIKPISKRNKLQVDKNRKKVYYHSTIHFIRSLYSNTLGENGYDIYQVVQADSTHFESIETSSEGEKRIVLSADVFNFMNRYVVLSDKVTNFMSAKGATYSKDEAYLTGIKGDMYQIKYYPSRNIHANLNDHEEPLFYYYNTNLYFAKDTCTIRKYGSLPGGEIIFEGWIVRKRMGAALPNNINIKLIQ